MARLVIIIIIIIISKISIIIINSYLQDKESNNGNFQLLRRWRSLSFTSNKYNNDVMQRPSQIVDMEAKLEPSKKEGGGGGDWHQSRLNFSEVQHNKHFTTTKGMKKLYNIWK
jgi:hypothetical protein